MAPPRSTVAPEGLRVFAYRNLTRGGWSLKALEGAQKGLVVAVVAACELRDCETKFRRSDMARMRRVGMRYVCAGITGTVAAGAGAAAPAERVTINPYLDDNFSLKASGQPIYGADAFTFTADAQCFAHNPR
jgi:hypothetical protein